MSFIAVYVTHSSSEEAKKIADHLLHQRLIACYHLFPVESTFWWHEKIDMAGEFVTLLKTRKENWHVIQEEIRKAHPYEVPCMMKIEVEANPEYEKWLFDNTKSAILEG